MIEQLKTIREALVLGIKAINHLGGAREAMPLHDAMPALTQLEAMVGEPWLDERGYTLTPLHTAAPVAQQHKTVTNDEQASAYMDARLWEFIDMAGMWPKAKPDPRIWAHVMVYAPPAQQARADLEAENQRLREALEELLRHFTRSPSSLADSETRIKAHAALESKP